MIKRYAMKIVGSIATSVESEGGAYIRYADIAHLLEEKTIEQHRAEFEEAKYNAYRSEDGVFDAWQAWKAARGVTE